MGTPANVNSKAKEKKCESRNPTCHLDIDRSLGQEQMVQLLKNNLDTTKNEINSIAGSWSPHKNKFTHQMLREQKTLFQKGFSLKEMVTKLLPIFPKVKVEIDEVIKHRACYQTRSIRLSMKILTSILPEFSQPEEQLKKKKNTDDNRGKRTSSKSDNIQIEDKSFADTYRPFHKEGNECRYREKNKQLQKKKETLNREIMFHEKNENKLKPKMDQMDNENIKYERLYDVVSELQQKIDQLTEEKEVAKQREETYLGLLKKHKIDIRTLEKTVQRISDEKERYLKLEMIIGHLQSENRMLKDQMVDNGNAFESIECSTSMSILRRENDSLQATVRLLQNSNNELQESLSQKITDLEQLRHQYSAICLEASKRAKIKIIQPDKKFRELKTVFEQQEAEIKRLRAENQSFHEKELEKQKDNPLESVSRGIDFQNQSSQEQEKLQNEILQFQTAIYQLEMEKKSFSTLLRNKEQEFSHQVEENKRLDSHIEQYQRELEQLREGLVIAKENNQKAEREQIKLHQKMQEQSKQLSILQPKLEEHAKVEERLRRELEQLKVEKQTMENTILEGKRQFNDTTSQVNSYCSEIENLRRKSSELGQELLNKTQTIAMKDEELKRLKIDNETLSQDVQNLKSKLAAIGDIKEKYHNLSKESDQLRRDRTLLEDQLRKRGQDMSLQKQMVTELNENIKHLKKDIELLNEENRQLNEANANANTKIHTNEVEFIARISNLEHMVQEMKKGEYKTVQLEHEIKSLQQKTETQMHENANLKKSFDNKKSEIKTLEQQIESLMKKNDSLRKNVKHSSGDTSGQLKDAQQKLQAALLEVDELKTRLSRAMGDKLTDNNPNIADLSDKNRPTKISERYQELYDNQWTDAFEVVDEVYGDEEKTIKALKEMLMETMSFCRRAAAEQMKQIGLVFSKGNELPFQMLKQFKDARKALAEVYGKELFKDYKKTLSESKKAEAKTACKVLYYVQECFEICWLMVVQDPPVVLGQDIPEGSAFNKDHYKAYTKSGDRVRFIVWPVLLLHQNGPVLCKGVAQG